MNLYNKTYTSALYEALFFATVTVCAGIKKNTPPLYNSYVYINVHITI